MNLYQSSFTIKLKVPNVIVKIACTGCGGDLVRHGDSDAKGKQLECIPCGTNSFMAYHSLDEKVDNVRTKIKELKKFTADPKNFEEIINNLGKDFEAIFE